MKELSDLANRLEGQKMFQVLAKTQGLERQGSEIIHFEIGDPDFDSPSNIVNAVLESIKRGETHYTDSSGLFELKVAAAATTQNSRGFKPDLDQLLVTPGANYQIRLAIGCIINPGDEAIIPDPSFVSYQSLLKNAGAKIVGVPLKEENNFRLDPNDVEKAVTSKTKMIIINSPSNPTGALMSEEDIKTVYEIAEKYDLYLLSDEVYARTVYEDFKKKFHSPSKYDHCEKRTIIVNGFSKAYAMTGWRLGVATGPSELIKKMGVLLESELSCVSPFIQRAGIEALKGSQEHRDRMRDEYKRRRDVVVEMLNTLPKVRCVPPEGAFYAFPNIKATGFTSEGFTDFILNNADVALCPGSFFGANGEGYVRLSFANSSMENIKRGIERMKYSLENR